MPSNNKGYNKATPKKGNNQKYLRHILSSDPFNAKEIDLADEKQVKERVVWYFNSCEADDMKPSLAGLARVLGTDISTLRRWRSGVRREGQERAIEIVEEVTNEYF